jgi:hypothetical protein
VPGPVELPTAHASFGPDALTDHSPFFAEPGFGASTSCHCTGPVNDLDRPEGALDLWTIELGPFNPFYFLLYAARPSAWSASSNFRNSTCGTAGWNSQPCAKSTPIERSSTSLRGSSTNSATVCLPVAFATW